MLLTETQHNKILEQHNFDLTNERAVRPPRDYPYAAAKPHLFTFSATADYTPKGLVIAETADYHRAEPLLQYGWFILAFDERYHIERPVVGISNYRLRIEDAIILADQVSQIKYDWTRPISEIRRAIEAKEHPYPSLLELCRTRRQAGQTPLFDR